VSEAAVQTANAGGVCTITLNRPAALNALNQDLAIGLRDAVLAAEQDQSARCLVIRGGQNFMAGGDLKWFDDLVRSRRPEQNRIEFERFAGDVHSVIVSLRRMPKPVLASVRAAAAGFGMSLMMACDLVIAADNAYFSLAYSLIGASPDGGSTFALPRIVGAKKAMEIALLSERFDAATAERLGLVNRVVPAAALDDETARLAARLAGGPTAAYGRTKQLLNASLNSTLESQLQREAEAFAQSASEPAFAEGVRAFIEKRKPLWPR
jgi:2-(1,2-epoxy-1,2-dihydrophenyl)acetyl-CoA isomerase